MARTSQMTQVGKRKIELSNLEKVLWPEDGVLKAELIQHYLGIAPTILAHIKGRPLSLVRFPDGIHEESFFQKNRPQYTPEWLDHEQLGDDQAQGQHQARSSKPTASTAILDYAASIDSAISIALDAMCRINGVAAPAPAPS